MQKNIISRPRPFFFPERDGRVFAVYHELIGDVTPWGNVLVVPAFNEEMNRCRSMVTMQAQALARLGIGTLVVDLFGTGESDGNYCDARWDIWLDNVCTGIQWLESQPGGCVGLLGIRLGVPLALAAWQRDKRPRTMVAWQAVVDGKAYLTQFMRMRIAANMDRTDIPKETTASMRAQLMGGQSIEVAGYEIHPELSTAIESIRLSELMPHGLSSIAWYEKTSGEDKSISPASERLLDSWRLAQCAPEVVAFEGPAFWALHDRFVAPDLVAHTVDFFQRMRPKK